MVKKVFPILLVCVTLFGCDSFPGPTLRNEFPAEINISVTYDDGSNYSEIWPSCRTVSIGASEMGNFGTRARNVGVNRITVEFAGKVEIDLDKKAIDQLLKRASEEQGYPVWVLDNTGIHFSRDRECSLIQAQH